MDGDRVISRDSMYFLMRTGRDISIIAIHTPISIHLHILGVMKRISNSQYLLLSAMIG